VVGGKNEGEGRVVYLASELGHRGVGALTGGSVKGVVTGDALVWWSSIARIFVSFAGNWLV
jgi:hypothetical protein